MSLLEVKGLNSYYGDSHILFDVGLRVEKNEVVALQIGRASCRERVFRTV